MDQRPSARDIVLRMMDALGFKKQVQLAEKLGIKPPSISSAIKDGKIPDNWFDIVIEESGKTREELTRPLELIESGVRFSTAAPTHVVADPGYLTDQDKCRAEREIAGDTRQRRAQLVARFGLVFDFVEEVYGENQVAVEDFFDRLKQLLMHEPDYRAWLYEKREEMAGALKKRAGGGSMDTPPDTLSAVGDVK